jgi:hypothetical protein
MFSDQRLASLLRWARAAPPAAGSPLVLRRAGLPTQEQLAPRMPRLGRVQAMSD